MSVKYLLCTARHWDKEVTKVATPTTRKGFWLTGQDRCRDLSMKVSGTMVSLGSPTSAAIEETGCVGPPLSARLAEDSGGRRHWPIQEGLCSGLI